MNNNVNLCKATFALLALILSVGFTNYSYADDQYQTRYPIVFVHGFYGFDDILGVDYFYGVPEMLAQGGAKVYAAKVSASNATEVRGEQLLKQVERIRIESGKSKVHLIGHSHGGPTARYVASVRPDYVASVTSIGGVNWGSAFVDVMRGQVEEGSLTESTMHVIVNAGGGLIDFLSGHPGMEQNSIASGNALTTAGSLAFNKKHPEGLPDKYCGEAPALHENGVYYYSWSGGVALTNVLDATDAFLVSTSLAFNEPNDGLVSSCSSHLGEVINDRYRMNHIDEINHLFGIHDLYEIDPLQVYANHIKRLAAMDL